MGGLPHSRMIRTLGSANHGKADRPVSRVLSRLPSQQSGNTCERMDTPRAAAEFRTTRVRTKTDTTRRNGRRMNEPRITKAHSLMAKR